MVFFKRFLRALPSASNLRAIPLHFWERIPTFVTAGAIRRRPLPVEERQCGGGTPMRMLLSCLRGEGGRPREISMNVEKYTERVRGFIQSAQSLAMREGHQQFTPLHILKVLLDDSEGLAGSLIDRAG